MIDLTAIDAKLTTLAWKIGAMAGDTPAAGTNIDDIVTKVKGTDVSASGGGDLKDKAINLGHLGYQIVFGMVTIGVLIAIVVKGFQFAMATAADRDDKKKSLVRVAIGGLIVFAATGIATTLARFGGQLFPTT